MKRFIAAALILAVLLYGCVVPQAPDKDEITNPDSSVSTEESGFVSSEPATEVTEEVTKTPTQEPTEAPTEGGEEPPKEETKTPKDSDIVRVEDYIPDIVVDLKYASTDNFTGKVIYEFSDVYLRYGTVKKLAAVQETLREQGLRLKIWDGYRPVYAQYKLWNACPDPTYVANPAKGGSSHSRGNTVDITLVDTDGNELEMPTGFDDFTKMADRDYADCTAKAAANAMLLEELMYKNGFRGYSAEWWHYTDHTSYDVENVFDPAAISTWYANCNQYISLRRYADSGSSRIRRVYKKQQVTLLGWIGDFAYVDFEGDRGYVLANYILPTQDSAKDALSVVKPTATYRYDQMMKDLQQLAQKYPQWATLSDIGTSENGLKIPVLILGNPESDNQILLQGAIHGREHMTAWLLTALAEHWLAQEQPENWDACFHVIPMMNPDGVAISQNKKLTETAKAIYARDIEEQHTDLKASEYASCWKANAKGVDLNRNFDAGWDTYEGRQAPSSECYKGEAPFCAAETRALQQYTLGHEFDITVSYHATGSILYSTCGNNKQVNKLSDALAKEISLATGYHIISAEQTDAAGYKDWAGDVLGIPSVTVEVGVSSAPLVLRELESIFARNQGVFPLLAAWAAAQ